MPGQSCRVEKLEADATLSFDSGSRDLFGGSAYFAHSGRATGAFSPASDEGISLTETGTSRMSGTLRREP